MEVTIAVACGRRIGICRVVEDGVDALTISSSGLVFTVFVTGIVRLKRRETVGKRGTVDETAVVEESSVELSRRYCKYFAVGRKKSSKKQPTSMP